MNHEEQRIWLIRYLLNEEEQYSGYKIPNDEKEQKNLLRALMNVRPPKGISDEFLSIQDKYLQEENSWEAITDITMLQPCACDSRLYLWQGDMTTLRVAGVVNPANSALRGCFIPLHNCADNIVHSKAGIQLRLKCDKMMCAQGHEEPTGQAKITPAYNLPCKYILHTVGPIVQGQLTKEHERLLASCYTSCLNLAAEHGLESLAFCCISTGVFMFPNKKAAEIAVETVRNWLDETGSQMKIIFNVYKDQDFHIYQRLLQ